MNELIIELLPVAKAIARRYSKDDELDSYIQCKLVEIVRKAFNDEIPSEEIPYYVKKSLKYYALSYFRRHVRPQHKPFINKAIVFPDLLELNEKIEHCVRTPLEYTIVSKLMEGYTNKEIANLAGCSLKKILHHRSLLKARFSGD